MMTDSLDKIITVYFAAISEEDFEYKRRTYRSKPLRISPTLLRTAYCPSMCGGCCMRFSLDYIASELPKKYSKPVLEKRIVHFNGAEIIVYTDDQKNVKSETCCYLRKEDGRCRIHELNPFSCAFEPLRFRMFSSDVPNLLGCFHFGRGWSYKTVDGKEGAKCRFMEHRSNENTELIVNKLKRLENWAVHFGLMNNRISKIIRLIRTFKIKNEVITIN